MNQAKLNDIVRKATAKATDTAMAKVRSAKTGAGKGKPVQEFVSKAHFQVLSVGKGGPEPSTAPAKIPCPTGDSFVEQIAKKASAATKKSRALANKATATTYAVAEGAEKTAMDLVDPAKSAGVAGRLNAVKSLPNPTPEQVQKAGGGVLGFIKARRELQHNNG